METSSKLFFIVLALVFALSLGTHVQQKAEEFEQRIDQQVELALTTG